MKDKISISNMAAAQSHHYEALDHNAAEFRLVTFARTEDGEIRGRLHVFRISECPAYVAISYTWGEDPPQYTIYLDGQKFQLRENIYQALQSILILRARNRPRDPPLPKKLRPHGLSRRAAECEYFWIVTICIDQACLAERNHQVCIMGLIFSNTDLMISWLGRESDRSVDVMQAICIGHDIGPIPFAIGQPPLPQHLRDMLDIFARLEYWSRLWIVQEIILAKDILVGWGNVFLPWQNIVNVGLCCAGRFPIRFQSLAHSRQWTNEYDENWVKLVMMKEQREFSLRDAGRSADLVGRMEPPNLYALIVQFAGLQCINPRDKVVGLLGLLPNDAAHLADYEKPIDEYFREVCKYAFTTAGIHGEWDKRNFQYRLGDMLGLSASEYSVLV